MSSTITFSTFRAAPTTPKTSTVTSMGGFSVAGSSAGAAAIADILNRIKAENELKQQQNKASQEAARVKLKAEADADAEAQFARSEASKAADDARAKDLALATAKNAADLENQRRAGAAALALQRLKAFRG